MRREHVGDGAQLVGVHQQTLQTRRKRKWDSGQFVPVEPQLLQVDHGLEGAVLYRRDAVLIQNEDADVRALGEVPDVDDAHVVAAQLEVAHGVGEPARHVAQPRLRHVDVGQELRVELDVVGVPERVPLEHEVHELGEVLEGALVDVGDAVAGEEEVAETREVAEREAGQFADAVVS